jgi:hypothetical protein
MRSKHKAVTLRGKVSINGEEVDATVTVAKSGRGAVLRVGGVKNRVLELKLSAYQVGLIYGVTAELERCNSERGRAR